MAISAILRAGLDLVDAHLGQADGADLALVLQRLELAELVGQRHLGVDPVQLEQLDPLQLQPAQRELGLLAQVGRAARPGSTASGPWRVRPALVAISKSSGYGCSASAMISSLMPGP